MAKVRHMKVEVTLNAMSKHSKVVPAWEVPVLEAQWGENLVIRDEAIFLDRELPEPSDEFERLSQQYGPKHADTPFVAAVYGNFGPGVNTLRDEISRAAGVQPRPVVPPVTAGEPVDVGDSEGGDSESDDYADLSGDADGDAEADA